MFKKFKALEGTITTIEITEKGKVNYSVGKKKTTFNLSECNSFTYEFETTDEKVVITEDMISGAEGVEPWLWLVISKGEERLNYNNDHAETRRQHSYSEQNDKFDTLMTDEDSLDLVLANLEKEAVRKAIQSLEPQQQELVMDVYFRGISMADIARRDGVSKVAITLRMKVILKHLKKGLKKSI